MKEGSILDEVVPAAEYSLGGAMDKHVDVTPEATVCSMAPAADSSRDSETRLLEKLQLKIDHLSPEQQKQLRDLICKYADVLP